MRNRARSARWRSRQQRAGRDCPISRLSPKEIIEKLNASVVKFLKTEDGIARLRKLGAEPAGGSPADMLAYVLAETEKWGKVAKFAGIKPD